MKKLTLLLAVIFIAATTFGQTKTDATKAQQKAPVKTEQAKQPVKTEPTAPDSPAAVAPAAGLVKKEGAFKENKEVAKPAGPLKKVDAPDKRYNSNKETPVKK